VWVNEVAAGGSGVSASVSGSGLGIGLLNGVVTRGENGKMDVNVSEVVKLVLRDDVSENVGSSEYWLCVISGAKRPRLSLVYWFDFFASLITGRSTVVDFGYVGSK
jgi:hypothetical protein